MIAKLLNNIFYARYPKLNLKFLVDFAEVYEKPCYKGKEGYYQRNPKGPFRLSESDIRGSIHVSKY